ncbi:hypothetical protein Q8F55_006064 [Vanrija albida]|uniref:Purine nucleoside permease n=1 Tax=Vanrija albida TaxID=181172 RepID=A0ABR3Q452_9TREE
MRFPLLALLATGAAALAAPRSECLTPKVFIVSMFSPEDVWTAPLKLTHNVSLPGLSPLFPHVKCDKARDVCHVITGEGEINAAATISAVVLSDKFDLRKTYFLFAGIAGVNPHVATTGSVGLARYAVQVALAYELDARQMPSNWMTGYWIQGTKAPGTLDGANIYGTEVFELNTNLRDRVRALIPADIKLNDTAAAAAYRASYSYAPANAPPAVFYGDVATADVYFAGSLLAEAFGNITSLWTNNTGTYALSAQEDNASFEAMVRAHQAKRVDFSRVVLLRTASDFDRAPEGKNTYDEFTADQGGFDPAVQNIFVAGNYIVQGILGEWGAFKGGVKPQEGWLHDADVFHTLATKRAGLQRRGVERRRVGRGVPLVE